MAIRDLDMSDVYADAESHDSLIFEQTWVAYDSMSTPKLEHARYLLGKMARETSFSDTVIQLRMVEQIMLSRIATSLCEGCLDRYGCDMCNPPTDPNTWGWSDEYLSGTGELVGDESYERYLNS